MIKELKENNSIAYVHFIDVGGFLDVATKNIIRTNRTMAQVDVP